jgi:hypothetical protein
LLTIIPFSSYNHSMSDTYKLIIDIEKRAKASGIKMRHLCREAGLDNSTFTRWRNKTIKKPRMDSYFNLIEALERLESKKR